MSAGTIPQEWRKGWVVLFPKPSKPSVEPKALRPSVEHSDSDVTFCSSSQIGHLACFGLVPSVCIPAWYLGSIRCVQPHIREVQDLIDGYSPRIS